MHDGRKFYETVKFPSAAISQLSAESKCFGRIGSGNESRLRLADSKGWLAMGEGSLWWVGCGRLWLEVHRRARQLQRYHRHHISAAAPALVVQ